MSDARLAGLAESAAQVIERQEWLAPLEDGLQRAVQAAFQAGGAAGQAVKNFLHGTWLGHPLHPVLTDVPIGAWTTALVFDTLDAGSRGWPWQQTARRRTDDAILVGIVGALGAALAGMTDWQHTDGTARGTGRSLAAAGFGALIASAWLGGRLVYRERIGIDHAQREEPEGFGRALRESELREGQPVRADINGLRVVLVKRSGRVYAIGER